jgi:hypothetical protein
LEIATIELSSLNSDVVSGYAISGNRAYHRKALKGLLMISLLSIFVATPILLYISSPFIQLVQPFSASSSAIAISSQSGHFLWFYFSHWFSYPGFWDWVGFFAGFGIGGAIAYAAAWALCYGGWITAATFASIVGGLTGGIGLLFLASFAAGF